MSSRSDRDLGPDEAEVHDMKGSQFVFLTKYLRRLGVKREDVVWVRYEAPRVDAIGRPLTPGRIIIEAIR